MSAASLRSRQIVVMTLLFGGYASLYFCRADLSVATPLLTGELAAHGLDREAALKFIGAISSIGVLMYALGKLFLGGLGDFWGGRLNFLIGLIGATVFTVGFAMAGALPLFTLAWAGNRLTQSLSWAGLIKVSSKWFDYSFHGMIIGILSVSYLVGDALARRTMGALIGMGFGWRELFYYAAAVAAFFLLASWVFLRESRADLGFEPAQANPLNVFSQSESRAPGVAALLLPLFRSRSFQLVCLLSFGCTIVRETFNNWTPVYLNDHLSFSVADAATWSAIFPGVGAVSVLLSGWLSDRLGNNGRSLIMFVGLLATVAALLFLMTRPAGAAGAFISLVAISLIAFCLLGPYSYLGGAFALDFGGKQGSAVASGIIDGIGYLGGALAGYGVPWIWADYGWHGVFVVLAVVTAFACLSARYLHHLNTRIVRTDTIPA